MRKLIILMLVLGMASTAPATIMVYDNLEDYLATPGVIASSYYSFDGWSDGSPLHGQMDFEVVIDIYGFHAHAELGLWSKPDVLSTYDANDPLVFTFENSPMEVISFGGYFASGDSQGNIINQDLVFTATDGGLDVDVEVTIPGSQFAGGSQFVGFISYDVLTQVTLNGVDDPNPNWPQVDLIYVNSPEPTTLVLLALGSLALLRKRRG